MIENKDDFQIVPYPDMSVLEKNRLRQLMIMENFLYINMVKDGWKKRKII